MMHVTVAERLEDLAESLSDSLGVPLTDPMATELVVVPTAGIRRWLSLRLARRLGSSGPDRCDGISANIDFVFPGALLHRESPRGHVHGASRTCSTATWHTGRR